MRLVATEFSSRGARKRDCTLSDVVMSHITEVVMLSRLSCIGSDIDTTGPEKIHKRLIFNFRVEVPTELTKLSYNDLD